MNPDLAQIIADYLDARAARDKVDEDIRYLEAEIRQRVAPGEQADLGEGRGVKVLAPAKKFDAALAEQVLTLDQITAISTPVISRSKAERMLAPVLYDQCRRATGLPSVRLL
jgi:hypothetical protein